MQDKDHKRGTIFKLINIKCFFNIPFLFLENIFLEFHQFYYFALDLVYKLCH